MICRSCGKTIPDGADKCPHCGARTTEKPAEKVSEDTQVFSPSAVEKKPLYKAADIDPERPVRRIDEQRRERPAHRRAPALTAALWILAVAAVGAAIFGICSFLAHRPDDGSDVPDVPGTADGQTPDDAENGGDQPDGDQNQTPDVSQQPPVEPKRVYEIRGTWRWESETDGYRNTYWVFSTAGKLDIYLVGDEYSYAWPQQYEYDKDNYVLGLSDAAMGLAWLDEDTFACGAGKAYRVDTSEIPDNAVNVRELEPEQDEEDPYLLPESSSRYLTEEDLEGMDKQQLTLARNEIFARHGRLFSTAEIQAYFNEQSWYTGYIKPANFDSSVLNDYERYNVAFISQYEDNL